MPSEPRSDGPTIPLHASNPRAVVEEAMAATTASGAIVVLATAVVVLAVGVALDVPTTAVAGLVAGGTLAVASWLCNGEGPVRTGLGSVTVAMGVLAAAYALTRPVGALGGSFSIALVVFAFGALVAGLGAGATIPGSLGSGQWARTVLRAGASCVLPALVVLWVLGQNVQETTLLVDWLMSVVVDGVEAVVFPVGPGVNVGGFLALLAVAAFASWYALGILPIANVVSADRREVIADRIRRTRIWLRRIAAVGVPVAIGLTAFPGAALQGVLVDLGVAAVLGVIVDAHWLRALLAVVAVLVFSAAVVTEGVRRVVRLDGRRVLRVSAATTPGGLVLLGVAAVSPERVLGRFRVGPMTEVVAAGVDFLGPSVLAVAVLVSLVLTTTMLLSVVTTAAAMGFVPDRTAAPSVAAGGLLVAAVAAGIGVGPGNRAIVAFAAVAASMIVWDVGNYGVDVTAELGGTTARPVEVLHAAGSVLVGVGLVGLALAGRWASTNLAAGGGIDGPGLFALVALVLAAVLLMSTLDG